MSKISFSPALLATLQPAPEPALEGEVLPPEGSPQDWSRQLFLSRGFTPEQADRMVDNLGAVAAEYRSKQPEPDRRAYPTLADIAAGKPIPQWLKQKYAPASGAS